MKDRPLDFVRYLSRPQGTRHVQLEPVGQNDTENVQGEFNRDELSAGRVFGGLGGPDGHNRIQDPRSDSVDETG